MEPGFFMLKQWKTSGSHTYINSERQLRNFLSKRQQQEERGSPNRPCYKSEDTGPRLLNNYLFLGVRDTHNYLAMKPKFREGG